ncbi:MAG: hypothetical protein ACJAVL_001590, partial [Bacteroidia bacterium]
MAEDKKAEDAKDKKAPAEAKAETTAAKKPRKRVAVKAKETEEVSEETPVAKKVAEAEPAEAPKVEEAKVETPVAEEAVPVVETTEEVAEEVVVKKAEPRKPAERPVDFDWSAIGKRQEVYAEKEHAELEAMYDATLSQV